MDKRQMVEYLAKKGYANLTGRGGACVPLKECPVNQLYAVTMMEVRKSDKKKANPVVVKEQQLAWNF